MQEVFCGLELPKQKGKAPERKGQSEANFILSQPNRKKATGQLEIYEEKQVTEFFC